MADSGSRHFYNTCACGLLSRDAPRDLFRPMSCRKHLLLGSNLIIFLKDNCLTLQDQENIDETGKIEQGESEDLDDILECLKRNSVESACPNTVKGIFVNFEQTRKFLSSK